MSLNSIKLAAEPRLIKPWTVGFAVQYLIKSHNNNYDPKAITKYLENSLGPFSG